MKTNQLKIDIDGTYFLNEIYFKYKDYSNIYSVEEAIKEIEDNIQYEKDQLKIMIALPTEALQKEADFEETTIRCNINNIINDMFENLQESYFQLYKLHQLRDLFEIGDGENSIEIIKNDKI